MSKTAWGDYHADGGPSTLTDGWTVMGRLSQRQRAMRPPPVESRRDMYIATQAGTKLGPIDKAHIYHFCTPAQHWRQVLDKPVTKGGPIVLAFLFMPPDSEVIDSLDLRGEYFNIRTGDTWDLFFPGYFRSRSVVSPRFVRQEGPDVPLNSRRFLAGWYFSPRDYDQFCRHIERESEHRWRYSGMTDIVLINAWVEPKVAPTIDWKSTISGQITANGDAALGSVIERMTRDLLSGDEAPHYGIADVVNTTPKDTTDTNSSLMVAALLAIAAALGVKAAGLG